MRQELDTAGHFQGPSVTSGMGHVPYSLLFEHLVPAGGAAWGWLWKQLDLGTMGWTSECQDHRMDSKVSGPAPAPMTDVSPPTVSQNKSFLGWLFKAFEQTIKK